MPKEIIYPNPLPNGEDADRRIEVGWSREGYVQLGVSVAVSALEEPELPAPDPNWRTQWVDLDRRQINELIRIERRARDAAYGRDE